MSREIWAFHCSTGSIERNSQVDRVAVELDLLLGQRQRHPAPGGLPVQPQLADLLEQPQRLGRGAVVDLPLRGVVVELGAGAHQGPLDRDVGALAGLVDADRPQQRRPVLVGQQRRGVLGEHRRVERHLGVRAVERLPAAVRLLVDRVAGRDEGGDVGDRVVDDVAVAVPLEVQCLVEVAGGRRVDREQLEVGAVQAGSRGAAAAARAACLDLGGEVGA